MNIYIYFFFYKTFVERGWEGGKEGRWAAWPPSITHHQSSDSGGSWQPSSRFSQAEVGLDHQALWEAQGLQLWEDGQV